MSNSPESSPPASSSDSPPAPPSDNNSSSSSSPPPSSSSEKSPPPPDQSSSSPPPPSSEKSPSPPDQSFSSPPSPPKSSSPPSPKDSSWNSQPSPLPPPSPPQGNNNNNNRNNHPPPPKNSGQHLPPRPLGPPRSTGSDKSDSSGQSSTNNVSIIVGVVAGAGLLIVVMALLCVVCCKKKKKKSNFDKMQYYSKPPLAGGKAGGDYYNPSPHQQYHQNDQGNLPPPPGAMGAAGHGNWGQSTQPPAGHGNWGQPTQPPTGHGNWGQAPLPPPINGTGSETSSNFSGPHGPSQSPPPPIVNLGFNVKSTFTYDELAAATQGFSQANLLGQGGFGYVHKGVLPNGKEIAVKSLKSGSGQGEREFQAEVEIISRVHHRHLVSLVGYCIAGGQRMLVYEFLPNNTLEFHLHGKGCPVMDWPTRLKIALGMARGLAYLHEDCHPRIIHRDIKTSNILLDFNFEAKVADFGLAKLSQDNFTHVSTRVMGTFGYLAPEYASSGKLTEKSDVFSFGVMLLELITGRRPVDLTGDLEDSLVDWARPLCLKAVEDGEFDELVDPRLEKNYATNEMARMVASAAASIRHSARRRPKMSQIVRALEGDVSLEDLNERVKPGQSSQFDSSTGSSDYDAISYGADMMKFRKIALDSREYPSSEFGVTSEYGLNPSNSSSEEMSVKVSQRQTP